MNTHKYYQYGKEDFLCPKCGWKGKGKDLEQGDLFAEFFEVHCPNCSTKLEAIVMFPTHEEVMKYGTNADKRQLAKQLSWFEELKINEIKDISEFPDLPNVPTTFKLVAFKQNYKWRIGVEANGKIIASELRYYEYYERYVEIGKMLKQKYGSLIQDLIPDPQDQYLYGDDFKAIDEVSKLRAFLKG